MEYWMPVIVSVVTPVLTFAVTAIVVVMWRELKKFTSSVEMVPGMGIDDVAYAAVLAVEQMFFDKDGDFKLQQALDYVKAVFPNVDVNQARMWIEAAVMSMNESQKN